MGCPSSIFGYWGRLLTRIFYWSRYFVACFPIYSSEGRVTFSITSRLITFWFYLAKIKYIFVWHSFLVQVASGCFSVNLVGFYVSLGCLDGWWGGGGLRYGWCWCDCFRKCANPKKDETRNGITRQRDKQNIENPKKLMLRCAYKKKQKKSRRFINLATFVFCHSPLYI